MRYYHDQHIGVYENAISDEWCDNVIKYFENNINKATIRDKKGGSLMGVRDTSFTLSKNKGLIDIFFQSFSNCFSLYKYKYPEIEHFELPLMISGLKLQKTLPTEGFHTFHKEQGSKLPEVSRIGVYTVYLNDVEEGGETEFLHQLQRVKPKKGTIVIFPAGYTHIHRGNTPFSGEKYIMTGWLELSKEENIGN